MSVKRMVVAASFAVAAACRPARSVDDAIVYLDASDADYRLDAADDLLDLVRSGTASREVVDALLRRVAIEKDPDVRSRLFEALAETGLGEVRPLLHRYLETESNAEQHHRAELYRRYLAIRDEPYEPDEPTWPYGTPGFPAAARSRLIWASDAPEPPRVTLKAETGFAARRIFGTAVGAFDVENAVGGRTVAGIWSARFGMFQGSTASGLVAHQYRIGAAWEASLPWVRPMLSMQLGYLLFDRFTSSPERLESFVLALRTGLACDVWSTSDDHAVYLAGTAALDVLEEQLLMPGGAVAVGARY